MESFARFGYVSKGFVYGLIGILALLAAFNRGGKTTDATGALHEIATQPFGQILLTLIAIGLVGYVIWRLIEAFKDPEHHGSDAKGLAIRVGYLISGLVYSGIAANAALLAMGSSSGGGSGNSQQDWTATIMQQPFGRWVVGLVGAIIVGLGFALIYQAYKEKFRRKLNMSELNGQQKDWLVKISRFGIAARGVVFIIIGFFVLQAAYKSDPNQVRGLDGALLSLSQQPFGKFLLALVAAGLVAYGIYLFVQARYRRLKFSG